MIDASEVREDDETYANPTPLAPGDKTILKKHLDIDSLSKAAKENIGKDKGTDEENKERL